MDDETFLHLTPDDKTRLQAKAERLTQPRGTVILRCGAHNDDLYLIRDGYVRVDLPGKDRGITVARLGPGQVFGEMSFLTRRPADANVVADEDVKVDLIRGTVLKPLLESDAPFSSRFFQSLAVCMTERLHRMNLAHSGGLTKDLAALSRIPLDRAGQLTDQQVPPELVSGVAKFKHSLQEVRDDFGRSSDAQTTAQERVSSACDDLKDILDHFVSDEALIELSYADPSSFRTNEQLAVGVGSYVFRETFSLFMASDTMARCYQKPRGGYVEDPETLQRIYDNDPYGDAPLGKYLDRWFLSRPICQARRHGHEWMKSRLQQAITGAGQSGPVRITTLGCAGADILFEALKRASVPVYATCIDFDAAAFGIARDIALSRSCPDSVSFVQADVVEMAQGKGRVALGPQRLIYGLTLADYVKDKEAQQVLDWCAERLEPGGSLAMVNLAAPHPDQAFMKHILEWEIRPRTEDELRNLFAGSRLGNHGLVVEEDRASRVFLAQCKV